MLQLDGRLLVEANFEGCLDLENSGAPVHILGVLGLLQHVFTGLWEKVIVGQLKRSLRVLQIKNA